MEWHSRLAEPIAPDSVVSFDINPGTLLQFLETRAEGGPRLKCFEGSVTLVSPGRSHESKGYRLDTWSVAVCPNSESITRAWPRPPGPCRSGPAIPPTRRTKPITSRATAGRRRGPGPRPGHRDRRHQPRGQGARAGAFLKIPELWVFNVPRHRPGVPSPGGEGQASGHLPAESRSRAFPFLTSAEVLERLDDPEPSDRAFEASCRAWARDVLLPEVPPRGLTAPPGLARRGRMRVGVPPVSRPTLTTPTRDEPLSWPPPNTRPRCTSTAAGATPAGGTTLAGDQPGRRVDPRRGRLRRPGRRRPRHRGRRQGLPRLEGASPPTTAPRSSRRRPT